MLSHSIVIQKIYTFEILECKVSFFMIHNYIMTQLVRYRISNRKSLEKFMPITNSFSRISQQFPHRFWSFNLLSIPNEAPKVRMPR